MFPLFDLQPDNVITPNSLRPNNVTLLESLLNDYVNFAKLTAGEARLVPLATETEDLLGEVDPLATAGTTLLVLCVHVLLP